MARVETRQGLYTSEAVSAGHPDKVCDRISDAVLDAALAEDPDARVAIEAAIKGHDLFILGELTANAEPDLETIARRTLADIGYGDGRWGLDLDRLDIRISVDRQAQEIADGVGGAEDPGAGDQGMMFGYACRDTPELMPLTIALAHRLLERRETVRAGEPDLGPDAKSQVTVRYVDGLPVEVPTVVLSTQHGRGLSLDALRDLMVEEVVRPALGRWLTPETRVLINPAGTFRTGGPLADAGLTGRKIIVDTYGGMAPHGGGAFSGKDPTKVDRSGAYAARQVARHAVERGWTDECLVRVAYAIGEAAPIAVSVASGANDLAAHFAAEGLDLHHRLRPGEIIRRLGLKRPIYGQTASGGHFGRSGLPWEAPLHGDGVEVMGAAQ